MKRIVWLSASTRYSHPIVYNVHQSNILFCFPVRTYSSVIPGTEVQYPPDGDPDIRKPRGNRRGNIFVSASEVASLINVNPHVAVADAIERFWEKTNRKQFREALTRNRLEFYTQEERLKELGALPLAKATVEADDPKEYQQRLAITLDRATTAQDRSIVKDFVNTSRGIKSERETFDILQKQRPQGQLKTDVNIYKKVIDIPGSELSYLLSGYIDGIETESQRVIEIKARQSRLFHHVPLYEQVQCQAYLFLTGFSTCEHVETFGGTQLSTTLQHDPVFWTRILERLNEVMLAFGQLMNDKKIQDDFLQRRELTSDRPSRKRGRASRTSSERARTKSLVFETKTVEEQ